MRRWPATARTSPTCATGWNSKTPRRCSKNTQFSVFQSALGSGGQVKLIRYPQGASLSRKEIDDLTALGEDDGREGPGLSAGHGRRRQVAHRQVPDGRRDRGPGRAGRSAAGRPDRASSPTSPTSSPKCWTACAARSPRGRSWPTRTRCTSPGSRTFPSSSGTRTRRAGRSPTTRSPCRTPSIWTYLESDPARCRAYYLRPGLQRLRRRVRLDPYPQARHSGAHLQDAGQDRRADPGPVRPHAGCLRLRRPARTAAWRPALTA